MELPHLPDRGLQSGGAYDYNGAMVAWIKQLAVGPMANFVYLLGDPASKQCVVIDAGWEADRIITTARDAGYTITAIWLTHTHFDHIGALEELGDVTRSVSPRNIKGPAPGFGIWVHEVECGQFADYKTPVHPTRDGDRLTVGAITVQCWHTPGHTPGGQCFVGEGFAFTGDTLFVDAIGRTDLPGSDPAQMRASLKRLAKLPPETVVYSGHDYGREPTSTIAEQLKRNPYLQ